MKKTKLISLALLALVVCMCFSSCIVVKGTPGLSAYDIAVKNGFVGTESEWLDSLVGEGGDTVVENQTINQDVTKNEITINGEALDISYAINEGFRSAVSIICSFSPSSYGKDYNSAGSGVIYKIIDEANGEKSALVITNYHVVYDSECNTENNISDNISLCLYGREIDTSKMEAEYVGGSMSYDIAILKIKPCKTFTDAVNNGSAAAAKVSSDKIYAGDTVIAIGNPEANGISATTGVISVDSEHIKMVGADGVTSVEFRVIRTDTAINSGNSGGGLFNAKGELVGIVNAKIMSTDVENIGYAIPVGVAKPVSDNIIHYCLDSDCETVMRATIGISIQIMEKWTKYNTETGMIDKLERSEVVLVTKGSLADGVMQLGDTIKSITIGNGEKITIERQHQLIDSIIGAKAGDMVKIEVVTAEGESAVREITIQEKDIKPFK